jgi:hypothetical protein
MDGSDVDSYDPKTSLSCVIIRAFFFVFNFILVEHFPDVQTAFY